MPRGELHKLMKRMAIPAIAAPMFLVSNPALALACCSEGIMGSFPAHGTRSREEFQAWLDEMQDGMKRLEDSGCKPAPWAVNLVVHPSNPRYPGDLELVEKYQVPVVLTSKGAPGDAIKRIHGWGAVALHDIANRRHAEKALDAGVDLDVLRTTLPGKIVAAQENKKRWKDIYTAGHGVGNIEDIPAAAELCRRLVQQYRAAKKTMAGDILAGLAEANRGDFASDEEVAAVINKYVKRS